MSFPDNSFDAVYAIEATVHAPSLEGIYSEIFRVLKPGGTFALVDKESRRFGELGLRSAMLSEERWLEKLSLEPLLLHMPLVRNQQQLTIGAAEETWNTWYAAAKS